MGRGGRGRPARAVRRGRRRRRPTPTATGPTASTSTARSSTRRPRRWDAAMAADADRSPPRSPSSGGRTSASRACSTRCSARTARSSPRSRARRATRSTRALAWGRSEIVLIDTAGIRRRGKVAAGRPPRTLLDAAGAPGPVARRRRGARPRRRRGADRAGRPRRGLRRRGGQGPRRRGQQVGPRDEKTDKTFDQYVEWIRNEVPFLDFAPILSISAKTGQRVGRVLEAAVDIWGERRKRISTGELNRILMAATDRDTAAARPRPPTEALLRDAGRRRAADVRVLRLGRVGGPLQLSALPREPPARDVRLRRHADPARLPRPDLGQAARGARSRPLRPGLEERPRRPRVAAPHGARRKTRRPTLMERPAGRGRRRRGVGDDAGPARRPRRAGHPPVPLPGDRGTDRRDRAGTRRDCPGVDLPRTVIATADPAALARRHRSRHLRRRPSAHLRLTVAARRAVPRHRRPTSLSVVKGLERGSLLRMSEVIAEAAGDRARSDRRPVRARTSPPRSPATCPRRPSWRPPTSRSPQRVVARLSRRRFRLYVNQDILGVELAGALKNVVAIAAGAADGLGFGDNGKAGLLTRGLAEMTRLGIAAGANPLTFAGLAGIGDLIATCGSPLSRNHRLGVELAKGRSWAEIEARPAGHRRGRLHGPRGARAGRPARRGDAHRARGPARAVRGQERPALPGGPAGPRVEGRAGGRIGLDRQSRRHSGPVGQVARGSEGAVLDSAAPGRGAVW